MIKLTQSFQHWLYIHHPDITVPLMFGHVELFTEEMKKQYIEWCQTEDGKRYLQAGDLYEKIREKYKL